MDERGKNMERTKLIEARHAKGWSQEEAAEIIGVTRNTLSLWERGLSKPYPIHQRKLCTAYQADAATLDLVEERCSPFPQEMTETADEVLSPFLQQNVGVRLVTAISTWPRQNIHIHDLQAQIMQMTEDYTCMNSHDALTRRDALRLVALLPIEMYHLSARRAMVKSSPEDILISCAAGITTCWYIIRGHKILPGYTVSRGDLAFVSGIVDAYIPTLKTLVESVTKQRRGAADLLVQCYLLKASLSRDIEGSYEGITFTHYAETYSQIADAPVSHILALRTQASMYAYTQHWKRALAPAEKAVSLLERATITAVQQRVQSYLYSGLATYQATNGQTQQALTSLRKAQMTFERSVHERVPIWIDHGQVNLLLNEGVTYMHLGSHQEALAAFAKAASLPTGPIGQTEIRLHEVMSEVSRDDTQRDMDWCIDRWVQGIEGAKQLQSDQWFNESYRAYTAMCAAWPGEKKVKDLREYIVHW